MSGKLVTQGEAPYDLGTAQEAKARSLNGSVGLTLRISFDGKRPEWVEVRMAPSVALEAAAQLRASAKEDKK
jgi:hypothetical protein